MYQNLERALFLLNRISEILDKSPTGTYQDRWLGGLADVIDKLIDSSVPINIRDEIFLSLSLLLSARQVHCFYDVTEGQLVQIVNYLSNSTVRLKHVLVYSP